jgi:hypothetical protein
MIFFEAANSGLDAAQRAILLTAPFVDSNEGVERLPVARAKLNRAAPLPPVRGGEPLPGAPGSGAEPRVVLGL